MRRLMMVAALAVLAACGADPAATPTSAPTTEPTPTPTPANFGRFDVGLAMDHVRALAAEIGPREAASEGDAQTARYISGRLEQLGWDVREQSFPLPQGGTSTNVIGTPPGFDATQPHLIVGAHRDTTHPPKTGPGANDNATGVGAMLDIARAVDEVPAPLPVMAVAFGAEEIQPVSGRPSRIGSKHLVARMPQTERDAMTALVNLDMIGNGEVFCGRRSVGPTEGTERCHSFGVQTKVLPDWSDHGPFAEAGLNNVWLWTGDVKCCYHNARDTVDNVRPDDLARSGKLALRIVRSYGKLAS